VGGIPKGVRDGGLLQHIVHRLKVVCFPKDIPEKIEINVAELEMNHSVHIRDISLPSVTILGSPESALVAVIPPPAVVEVEAAPAPTEGIAEPEVLGKGKKAEEGEEGAEEPKEAKETKEAKK
jgi:large subunit ribosomal protein L25